jgi:hypothetical protein
LKKKESKISASGRIEWMGLWKDTGDRAMPIKMNVNPGNSNQVKEALESLIKEMREKNSTTGFIAAQSYN